MSYKGKSMAANRSRSMRRENWSAGWIWCEGESRPRNFYLHARKTFKLDNKPETATLRITADSRYKLFVNGSYVGRGPVPSDPHRLSYDTYDISALLSKGQNVIAVLVQHLGQGTYSYIPGRAAFICEADIDEDTKIVTDETWKALPAAEWTAQGARINRRIGYQEVYDASLEPEGWTAVKFKDAKWPQAVVLGRPPMPPFDRLVSRDIPHLKEELAFPAEVVSMQDAPAYPEGLSPQDVPGFMADEDLVPLEDGRVSKFERFTSDKDEAVTITVPQPGGVSVILDFGREVFGCVELAFTRSHGGIVDIGYSEALEDGRVNPYRDEMKYTDRLVLRKGKQVWCSFEPRAFRYIQLDFRNCPKPVAISRVVVRETAYPVEWNGSFESSDELINQIWKTAADTARMCMQDTYIDSPWRERAQWWDNAAVASKVAYYAFGDNLLLKQGLKHIAASQDRDGAIFALYPSATRELFPDFGAIWVMSVWDCYAQDEDKGLLSDLYPAVVRWLKWIGQFTDSYGVLANVRGDLFIDWAEIDRRGEVMALNCLYIGALRAACRMAETLKKSSEAEEWAGIASALKMKLAKYFWSPSRGLFADARIDGRIQEHYTRQTNILAALYDVADHYQKLSIYRQMLDDKRLPPITTPNFVSVLAEGLFKNGSTEQALILLRNKFGEMLSLGATTFWEYLTAEGSLCYGASSAPAYQLQAYILGVKPSGEPGRVIIEPRPADLEWAKGVVPTVSGPVGVDWKIGRRGMILTVDVPKGMTAEVVPPRPSQPCRVIIDGKDRHDANIEVGAGIHNIQILKGAAARGRRQRVVEAESVEVEQQYSIPPGRGDIETVEQMIKILADLEREAAEAAEAAVLLAEEQTIEEPPAEKRKRHRRRSKHPKSAAQEVQVEVQETSAEATDAVSEPVVVVEEPVAAPEKKRSSRRRRKKSPTQVEEPVAAQVQEAQPEQTAVAVIEPQSEPVKESQPSKSHAAEPAPKQEEPEVTAPVQEEAVEVVSASPQERKCPSRHRKKRSSNAQPEAAEVQPEEPVAQVEAQEAPVVEQSDNPAAKPSKTRRRRRQPSVAVEETAAQPVVEEPVVVSEAKTEEPESSNGKKPRKHYRRHKSKPAKPEDAAETSI